MATWTRSSQSKFHHRWRQGPWGPTPIRRVIGCFKWDNHSLWEHCHWQAAHVPLDIIILLSHFTSLQIVSQRKPWPYLQSSCLCLWMFCLYTCMCTTCIQFSQKPKRESDTLELTLQMVISHHVCAKNQTRALWKNSSQYSKLQPSFETHSWMLRILI